MINSKASFKRIMSFIWEIIKPYKWWYVLIFQAPILGAFYPLMYNYSIKLLIDSFTGDFFLTYTDLFYPIFLFIFAQIFLDVCWRVHNYASWQSLPFVRRDMMCNIYDRILNYPYTFFQNNLSGSIVSRIKGIADGYYHLHSAMEHELSKPVLQSLISLIAMFTINVYAGYMLLIFSIFYVPLAFVVYKKLGTLEQRTRDDYHKIIGFISDAVSNIFNVFTFATRTREKNKISSYYNSTNIPLQNDWFRYDFWSSILMSVIFWVAIVGIFFYLIHLRNNKILTVGDIAFVMATVFVFTENIWQATISAKDFIRNLGDFRSSFSVIDSFVNKNNDLDEKLEDIKISQGNLEFKNVNFSYDSDKIVFNNLNLSIKAGEKIGIVGSSGAGKTTMINLLMKNFQINSGDILIDKQSIYRHNADSLRSQISLIPQDVMLFHRTIGENIAYSKQGATMDDVIKASKVANLHDFIENLPNKYNTMVGERGLKLSGGQRQRIAIARAILKNSHILILDEATSSLDTETEQEIQKSINSVLDNNKATVIAIAHRLSTIKHMDRIIVMSDGNVAEDGSFQELFDKKGKFRKLWDNQINGLIV